MKPKWKYVFAQIEDTETEQEIPMDPHQDIQTDPHGLKEQILQKLRSDGRGLDTNSSVLNALDKCLSNIGNNSVQPDINSVRDCVNEKLKTFGNTEIANVINEVFNPQGMIFRPMDPNTFNKRILELPKNENITI